MEHTWMDLNLVAIEVELSQPYASSTPQAKRQECQKGESSFYREASRDGGHRNVFLTE